MPLKTISITAYNRPHYFEQLLLSLRANDLKDWEIYIQIEPSDKSQKFINIANKVLPKHSYHLKINKEILGIRHNPFSLLKNIFELGSEINIYLEEDMLVSPDVTCLANWYNEIDRTKIMCLNLMLGGCSSTGFISNDKYPALFVTTKCFNSLGFVLTHLQWSKFFEKNWLRFPEFFTNINGEQTDGWDLAMYDFLLSNQNLKVLSPLFARATHTGRQGGTHCNEAFHQMAFENLPIYMGHPHFLEYKINNNIEHLPYTIKAHLNSWNELQQMLVALKRMKKNSVLGFTK